MQSIKLVSADGARIAARLYRPSGPPAAAVLVAAAMGVRQEYYAPFARWLAQQGYLVATFDYRGIGESLPPGRSLRGFRADLFDWARDTDCVIDALLREAPEQPLQVVGHSLGAQLAGMLEHRDRIASLIGVAAGSGYWRDVAPPLRRIAPVFWYLVVPVATMLAGYFPGERIGRIGDLPRGVIWQWRRWCLNPRYHVGAEGAALGERFAAARFPVLAFEIADDEMLTARSTRVLVDLYANAPRRIERITPTDAQARRIGHLGFFREQFAPTLWQRAAELLQPGALARSFA